MNEREKAETILKCLQATKARRVLREEEHDKYPSVLHTTIWTDSEIEEFKAQLKELIKK